MVTLEQLLDKIAEQLILDPNESGVVTPTVVRDNQKTIRNGTLQLNRTNDDRLVLYQKDIEANKKDLLLTTTTEAGDEISILQSIADRITDIDNVTITIESVGEGQDASFDVTIQSIIDNLSEEIGFIVDTGNSNPLNVSQFIPLEKTTSVVQTEQAEEFLDTNIYELLPTSDTRQNRINRFFQELNALLPPIEPNFDDDGQLGVDRLEDGTWIGSVEYSQNNSIAYSQDNPDDSNIDEEDAFIHRLKNLSTGQTNQNRTIEDIYNTILPYLTDILEDPTELEGLPEYKNQSNGYLQFRNLNQGIIIRNTNKQFVEGLDPSNLTYLTPDETGGFTITMWVRFLDKVSSGTLFNFGNPTRAENPFGFKLETYVVNKNNPISHNSHNNFGELVEANNYLKNNLELFKFTNSERFVRLVINDGVLRDSHTGNPTLSKLTSGLIPTIGGTSSDDYRLLSNQLIPEDFNEWYFICASFNPIVDEDGSFDITGPNDEVYDNEPDFWLNHINLDGTYTTFSELGNKCKVEIISKSDLLRARGFKV